MEPTVNPYDVLNLSRDCERKDIQKSYRRLAKEYHPDRHKGEDNYKEYVELFDFITKAYNILINENERAKYDEQEKVESQTHSHADLKYQSQEYFETDNEKKLSKEEKKQKKEEAEKVFNATFKEMDEKVNYTREEEKEDPINKKEALTRMEDMILARENDEIEFTHEKIFEGGPMDNEQLAKFNALFDKKHKSQQLIKREGGPTAFNKLDGGDYIGLDTNYGDAFVEGDFGGFSTVDFGNNLEITEDDIDDIEELEGAEYTENHKVLPEDFDRYNKSLDDLVRERQLEQRELQNLSMGEYSTDFEAMGEFGITNQIGVELGSIVWENNKDTKAKYQRLLEDRNKVDS